MMDIQEMEIERRRGREFAEELGQRDRAEQVQWQYDRILGGRYNARCTEIRDNQRANYLNGNYRGRDQSMIASFRCGNEERGSKYWKEEKETVCRLCNGARETLGHMLQDCKELKRENSTIRGILKGEEEGAEWMRMVLEKRRRREEQDEGRSQNESTILS